MSELSDIQTGSRGSSDIVGRLIAAIQDIDWSSMVCQNPPKRLQ